MAITINKDLTGLVGAGSQVVIMSDDYNVAEFSSDQENIKDDFKFRIEISITPKGSGNTASPLSYITYRQYGYINLYSIINSSLLYSGLDLSDITNSDTIDIKRSKLTVRIIESWRNIAGGRSFDFGTAKYLGAGKTIYVHKGISKTGLFSHDFPVVFNVNVTDSTISLFKFNTFAPNPLEKVNIYITYNGSTYGPIPSNTPFTTGSDFNGYKFLYDSYFLINSIVEVKDDNHKLLYQITYTGCNENNFINWRNDNGYLDVFNFGHSHEKGGKPTGQDYYTDHKKTAIVSTENTITVSTGYINDKTYNWLQNILKSPEVYWNGQPVTPIRKGFTEKQGRFETLINLTLELQISTRERSILL